MKMNWKKYFVIVKLFDDIHGGLYYKIIDRQTKRFCFSTPIMLKDVVVILLKCIRDGKYIKLNNHSIDYKVLKIFLDDDKFEKAKKEIRTQLKTRKLKNEIVTSLEWKLVNEYLAERSGLSCQ